MKRKFLAAMALAVSISAVPLTAYASATVSSSSSVNTQSQVQSESESAEVPATPESTATPTLTPDVSVTPEPSTTPEPTTTPGASEDENDQYADGWNQVTGEDGKTYWVFYDAGSSAVKKNSLFEDGQKTYLTDENGYLLTGEQQYTDEEGVVHTFYFSEDGEKPGENSEYGVRITGFAANGKYYGPELVTNQKFEADGDEYYAGEDGTISRDSFVTVDGIIYYFGEDGKRVTEEGWITVGDASYYLMDSDSDGKGEVCVDGNYASNQDENSKWLIVDGGWYLLDAQDGHRMSGLQKNGNDLYYLDPEQNDKMFCSTNDTDGWKQLDGTWYFFRSWGGAYNNGWNKLGIDWYWFNEDCSMASDEWMYDGENLYYIRDWGAMLYNDWKQGDDGEWYYFRSWGGAYNNGWARIGIDWYWFDSDCTMRRGEWMEEGGNLYYLRDWGGMLYNDWKQRDNGEWYYFRSWGAAENNGWAKVGNDWYWFDRDCTMARSQWLQVGSDWYYLRDWGGRMHDQWGKVGIDWYYFGSDGKMLHDQWLKDGNDWYYLRSWGGMMYNQWYTENGKTYYFRSWGGRCHSGTFVIDGETYSFDSSGVLKELQQVIVIDPGHQRKGDSTKEPLGPGSSVMKARVTSGTSGCVSGLDEYELNLQVSLLLRTELESRGYTVYMTRETHDVNISNKERAEYATSVGGDILVRIHANGSENSSVSGALCMAPSDSNAFVSALAPESQRLSQCIVDSYCQATGFRNRGVYITDDMSGINWSTMPVTIVEMGFMSNPGDDSKMADSGFQKTMVKGIADGIDAYFG